MSTQVKSHRVLLTGIAGWIGRVVAPALTARGHEVVGYDLKAVEGYKCIVGDICDAGRVGAAMEGIDTVVHLAAYPNNADFEKVLLRPNVLGMMNVLHAAGEAKVKRVVLASSVQVLNGLRRGRLGRPIKVEDGTKPNNDYGLAKVWMEHAGEMYARKYGMSVIVVRIGWFVRTLAEKQLMLDHGAEDIFLSQDDSGRLFAATVECADPPGDVKYAIVFGYGKGGDRAADMAETKRLTGYEPMDEFPAGSRWEY